MAVDPNSPGSDRSRSGLIVSGLGILIVFFAVRELSPHFLFEADINKTPFVEFFLLQMLAGGFYLLAVYILLRRHLEPRGLAIVLVIGLLLRLLLFDTTPILEIDYYRYLWDGAVFANGYNPYMSPPIQAGESELSELALQSGSVIDRINYSDLKTIYPPLTQVFFALSYWLDSWNLNAWRSILLFADIAGLLLIMATLKTLQKPLHWCLIYWWNPLLLQQTYNAAHMDVLLVAPLVGAIWMLITNRHLLGSALLTIAAGIKLWPLLLLPFALRPLLGYPKQLFTAVVVVASILALTVLPLLYFGLGEQSGLGSFAQQWQRNSAIFPLLESVISLFTDNPGRSARILIAFIIFAVVFWLNLSVATCSEVLIQRMLFVIGLLFLLSPAQFPWYAIWFLPLLCFRPSGALILLTVLMPIYYWKFLFIDRGNPEVFDYGVVWLQYLPVLTWFAVERLSRLRTRRLSLQHV